jgi:hypothetical protein
MTDLQPMLNWTTAVMAGGGVAGITQALTVMAQGKIHYPDGWTWQLDGRDGRTRRASLISLLALAAPLAALAVVILIFWLAFRFIRSSAGN